MIEVVQRSPDGMVLELDLADRDVDDAFASIVERLTGEGIAFVTLRELQGADEDWLERFTTLDNQTRSAGTDPRIPRTIDEMAARLTELEIDPSACFVAHIGDLWIGYTILDTAHSSTDCVHQSWTGVLPAYRRRGIATALKLLTVRYARQHGYRRITTRFRADNSASHALNRRLGFRPPAA